MGFALFDTMAGKPNRRMPPQPRTKPQFPNWLRASVLVWFVVWFPEYWRTWGAANFIHLCDVAVILTCVGVWANGPLLISSQAVGALLVDAAWFVDVVSRMLRGRGFFAATDYLFDPHYALWVRLLSLFHICLPPLLLWGIHRLGYDRHAWTLQCAIALPAFVAARFTSPAQNINFAFVDPFFHHSFTPAPVHILISWLFMCVAVYLPTHLLLRRLSRNGAGRLVR